MAVRVIVVTKATQICPRIINYLEIPVTIIVLPQPAKSPGGQQSMISTTAKWITALQPKPLTISAITLEAAVSAAVNILAQTQVRIVPSLFVPNLAGIIPSVQLRRPRLHPALLQIVLGLLATRRVAGNAEKAQAEIPLVMENKLVGERAMTGKWFVRPGQ